MTSLWRILFPAKKDQSDSIHYYEAANNWADDVYLSTVASKNRYQMAFIITLVLCISLTITTMILAPKQHTELVLIHHYNDGTVWVEPTHQTAAPLNSAEIESDLVRYIINRESYSTQGFNTQYRLINVLSNSAVANDYREEQNNKNPQSPLALLGTHSIRTVEVNSVIFLDKAASANKKGLPHSNLAEVSFTTTDTNLTTHDTVSRSWTATLSWVYLGTPKDPKSRWQNWRGFSITQYQHHLNHIIDPPGASS